MVKELIALECLEKSILIHLILSVYLPEGLVVTFSSVLKLQLKMGGSNLNHVREKAKLLAREKLL